ncbi:MAG: hypothetical protein ACRDZY_02320, partial [Acidimicrobiales bacterium]
MQIPTDPTDAAALDTALQPGQRRNFAHLLEVDWNRDGLFTHAQSDLSAAVTSCQVTRIRADSTVGAAAVASGAAAAQLTAVLEGSVLVGGVWVPVTELLAPYNFTSPLYRVRVAGTPIRWTILTSTSRGWIGTQQMLGTIDQRGAQRSTNRVTLICLDAVVQLQRPAWWPPYAVDGPSAALAGDDSPQRGLASSVVDQLCNANGLRTRPRPPWQSTTTGVLALVWLPLCGSFAPAAGRVYSIAPWGASGFFPELYNQSPAAAASYWITGQWGLARDAAAGRYPGSLIYTCRDTQPTYTGRSTSITAWILCGPNSGTYDPNPSATLRQPVAQVHMGFVISSNYYALRLGLATNGVTLQIQVEVGTTLIYRANYVPGTDAWRHVQVQLDHSAGPVRAKLIVDGVVQQNFVPTGSTNTEA